MDRLDLLETIYTTRSIRRFLPDPVPDEIVARLIEAATRAPNGRNAQPWHFIAIRDSHQRLAVGEVYRRAWDEYSPPSRLAAITDPRERRRVAGAFHLGATMGTEPPLLIVVCGPGGTSSFEMRTTAATIYPAVQNLLLAARAYGLAGCLTTVHLPREAELRPILGLPDEVATYAIVPIGRTTERFGPLRRRPVGEVTFAERWGQPLPGTG
ncbi:MAG: nitroreductase [Chloroflexi bacterium]|nr:nitroreductase [Chloroflexota bacterium]